MGERCTGAFGGEGKEECLTQGCREELAGQGKEPHVCATATQLVGCCAQDLGTTWERQCPEGEHRELAQGAPHDPQPPHFPKATRTATL